jgi:hypothetical protein
MASGIEIRTTQKNALFELLMLKREMLNEDSNANIKYLDRLIIKSKAVMEAEDVAYVEKMIAEIK